MLRCVSRAAPGTSSLRASLARKPLKSSQSPYPVCLTELSKQQTRAATAHAISNPTLAGIEKRWEEMAPQEQADLWMALRDRMKTDWHELTLQERKAAYWIAFGPHGPRKKTPKGENWIIFRHTMAWVTGSVAVFFIIRAFARPPPKTMNEQWQKMTNEYLKGQNVEPITGLSSEGYKGKGMIQSRPLKGGIPKDEDEE